MPKRQYDPNPAIFIMLCVLTVIVVIFSCSTPAYPAEIKITIIQQEDYHTPKRIQYGNYERYYVDYNRSYCQSYKKGRYRHKQHISLYQHERHLTHSEVVMKNKVIRNGGRW